MSTSAPTDPQASATPPAGETPSAHNFEQTLRTFWKKNSKLVYLSCITVFVVILVRGGLEWRRTEKETEIANAYAASNTSEKLKSFASQHPDHLLGAAALLKLADEAYAAGKFADAAATYQKSAAIFKGGPFGGRALVGAAISNVLAGQTADGETKLKQLADDTSLPKVVRAEAAYHFGVLAAEAGRKEDAVKYFDLSSTLDAMGAWGQRAFMQRATLSPPTAPALLPTSIKP